MMTVIKVLLIAIAVLLLGIIFSLVITDSDKKQ
jgi:hypothetical protein